VCVCVCALWMEPPRIDRRLRWAELPKGESGDRGYIRRNGKGRVGRWRGRVVDGSVKSTLSMLHTRESIQYLLQPIAIARERESYFIILFFSILLFLFFTLSASDYILCAKPVNRLQQTSFTRHKEASCQKRHAWESCLKLCLSIMRHRYMDGVPSTVQKAIKHA
jgi:hypothetical protein